MNRKEYLDNRSIYINGAINAGNKLRNIVLLVSTGGFIYTRSLILEVTGCQYCFLVSSWGLFAVSLIVSILGFYWSGKSHEIQLEIYDKEYNEEKDNNYILKKSKLHKLNKHIEIVEPLGVFMIIFGIIFLFISFLVA